jgi:DNA replication licensing factor MCM4
LSRFDLIYMMLDEHDPELDKKLANHIVNLYKNLLLDENMSDNSILDKQTFKDYITFAKCNIHPKLNNESKEALIKE